MRKIYLVVSCFISLSMSAATRFAVLSDTHVLASEIVYDTIQTVDSVTQRDTIMLVPHEVPGEALQALALCAEDLKSQQVDFIVHAGDMTDRGDSLALVQVRRLLVSTELPFFVTTGNHETKHSPSALQDVKAVFDSVRFALNRDGILLLGMNDAPIMHPGDGHFAVQDTLWLHQWLDSLGSQPTILLTHIPVQPDEVDNWYAVTGLLRQYNTQVIISGHHHENEHLTVDGIDNVVCRSALPDEQDKTGYTIVEISNNTIRFSERAIQIVRTEVDNTHSTLTAGAATTKEWLSLPLKRRNFPEPDALLLPSYAVNDSDSLVVEAWRRQMPYGFYATPVEMYGRIYIGDDSGTMYAFDHTNGRILWRYKTTGRIVGSAAVKDGRCVFASANGNLYCVSVETGKLQWKQKLGKPITGSVAIDGQSVYVGSSDSCLYALKLMTGQPLWTFRGFGNYCIAKPVIYKNKIFVGAYDGCFYALDKRKGKLLWKWDAEPEDYRQSPAAVTPCADEWRVYVSTPDGYLTALNAETGSVQVHSDRWKVRESIGMSDAILYAKTAKDTIIAINLKTDKLLWATDAGYGKDNAATQLVVEGKTLFATTKNGLVIALDAQTGDTLWLHKTGNCLLTTPCSLSDSSVVVASSDGMIARIERHLPAPPDTSATDSVAVDSLMLPIDNTVLPNDTVATE